MARTLVNSVIIKPATTAQVGDVVQSMLTEAQFQAERDGTWVLADGRSVSGSKYETITGNANIPDMRGQFLRGKNNSRSDGQENPDGDVAVGTQTGDGIRNITGYFQSSVFEGGNSKIARSGVFNSNGSNWNSFFSGGGGGSNTGTRYNFDTSAVVPTAADNRPKNVTVNIFIKINE